MKYKYADLNRIITNALTLLNKYDFSKCKQPLFLNDSSRRVDVKTYLITSRNTFRSLSSVKIRSYGNYLECLTDTANSKFWNTYINDLLDGMHSVIKNKMTVVAKRRKNVITLYDEALKELFSSIDYKYTEEECIKAVACITATCDLILIINSLIAVTMKLMKGISDDEEDTRKLIVALDLFMNEVNDRIFTMKIRPVNNYLWEKKIITKLIVVNKTFSK